MCREPLVYDVRANSKIVKKTRLPIQYTTRKICELNYLNWLWKKKTFEKKPVEKTQDGVIELLYGFKIII